MSDEDTHSSGKQIAAYFLAGTMILFLAGWTLAVSTGRCSKRDSTAEESDSARQVDPSVGAELEVIRASMWASFREQVMKLEYLAHNQRLHQRQAYIEKQLPTKVIAKQPVYESQRDRQTLDVVEKTENNLSGDSTDALEEGYKTCAICLNDYKGGDEISWSQNCGCIHHFHRACITEWLLKHDDCPCCRQVFLFPDEKEAGGITIPCTVAMFDQTPTSGSGLPNELEPVVSRLWPCSSMNELASVDARDPIRNAPDDVEHSDSN